MKPIVPVALRERLGEDATHAFYHYIESSGEQWRDNVMTACTERIDLKIAHLASREDLIEGFAAIRQEMANLRVELLRWSFTFWIGQVGVTTALMALLFRLLKP
ncbi:MAG: hypothetical protein Q7R30_10480 [Acidobacteriota bacterium]|nr:hypothetical protein [Acidobacteriota bacterium]